MKVYQQKPLSKMILSGILAVMILGSFNGCTKQIAFLNSSVVPAANGTATVKKDKNENYSIKLSLSNLAEVHKLQPPNDTYVVWILTTQGNNVNIGQIQSSKKLNISFETVSSFQPGKIFITAETNGNAEYPSLPVVLSTDTF